MADFQLIVPVGTGVIFIVVVALAFLLARKFLWKIIANSVLGLAAFYILNQAGFKLSYSLLNLGLVAALGLGGFVLVLILKTIGWTA